MPGQVHAGRPRIVSGDSAPGRGPVDHVVILDGTMSSLKPGFESNAGLTFGLLSDIAPESRMRVFYHPGDQWSGVWNWRDVAEGRGMGRQIREAYGFISTRYRRGDRIFLFGYSRGAYAVRSLAGMIDMVGLLRSKHATVANIRTAWRLYRTRAEDHMGKFASAWCHADTRIEMVGVWDTVRALGFRGPRGRPGIRTILQTEARLFGLPWPFAWRVPPDPFRFHNHTLGPRVRHGFQALALDEDRLAYAPVIWDSPPGGAGHVEQVWFRGAHGDVGGHILSWTRARPLSNIPLAWMLEKAEACGMSLPDGWRGRFQLDASAPPSGTYSGWGVLFLLRKKRRVGADPSEYIHPSAAPHGNLPLAPEGVPGRPAVAGRACDDQPDSRASA